MKKVLLLLAVIFSTINGLAFEFNGLFYEECTDTTAALVRSRDYSYKGDIVIPETVTNGDNVYKVTEISIMAFNSCQEITSVSIPGTVEKIYDNPFGWNTKLTKITVRGGDNFHVKDNMLIAKDGRLVAGLYTMTEVEIPEEVTYIGKDAFNGCENLKSVKSKPNSYTKIESMAFASCINLEKFEFPNTVKTIGGDAFYRCRKLESIELPRDLVSISGAAFSGCYSITSIIIPEGTSSIGSQAFNACINLEYVEIPSSVKSIHGNPFDWCTNLKEINLSRNSNFYMDDDLLISKDGDLISCIIGKSSIEIPKSVNMIYQCAFVGDTTLTYILIPETVSHIGGKAFSGTKLKEIICLNPTPPATTNPYQTTLLTFDGVNKEQCIVKVPMESLNLYKTADQWKDFWNIVGLETGINDIYSDDEKVKSYSIQGTEVDSSYKGIVIRKGRKYLRIH